jgi:hypothetical protein
MYLRGTKGPKPGSRQALVWVTHWRPPVRQGRALAPFLPESASIGATADDSSEQSPPQARSFRCTGSSLWLASTTAQIRPAPAAPGKNGSKRSLTKRTPGPLGKLTPPGARSERRSRCCVSELAPNAGPGRLGNSGFIRGSAGRGCRAADEARSAFCRRGSYADERRYSLYAKPRIFAELRRGSGTSWRSGTLNGTCR